MAELRKTGKVPEQKLVAESRRTEMAWERGGRRVVAALLADETERGTAIERSRLQLVMPLAL
ncbi:hypothetical protein ACR8G9_22615 [Salmonella enterica subsp. enterica serovar Paratyphi A]